MNFVNDVFTCGTVVEKGRDYAVLSRDRENGGEDLIFVKRFPYEIGMNQKVYVEGMLIRDFRYKIGIEATYVVCEDEEDANFVNFTGKIYGKGRLRTVQNDRKIIDLVVQINHNTYIPVIAWSKMAREVYEEYRLGDMVEIVGYMLSREFVANSGEIIRTNEVIISGIIPL